MLEIYEIMDINGYHIGPTFNSIEEAEKFIEKETKKDFTGTLEGVQVKGYIYKRVAEINLSVKITKL